MDASKKFFKRANPFHLVMTFILSFFSHFCGLSNCQSTPVSRQSPIQVVTEPDVEQLVDHYTTPPPPAVLGLHGNLSVIVIIVNYQIVPFRAKRQVYHTVPGISYTARRMTRTRWSMDESTRLLSKYNRAI